MAGIGKNTRESNGPPYLSLSYIEAPKPKRNDVRDVGRVDGSLSFINDPIQSINDQVVSTIEEIIELGTVGTKSVIINLKRSNLDEDPNNVIYIYRVTDFARIDNFLDPSNSITVSIVDENTFTLTGPNEDNTALYNDLGITKGNKIRVVVNAKTSARVEARAEISLDFHYLASQNFGFGVERYFLEGTARKSIQQTRGDIIGDKVSNNFFVDTWGRAPDTIVLSGVIEMPHGLDFACRFKNGELIQSGRQVNPTENSFIGTIEEFYRNNNNPVRVNRGEVLTLNDYFRGEFYIVTFKSRKFEQSVDKPNLMPWQIELAVLARTDVNSFQDESLSNKGILNQLLNFGIG